MLNHILRYKASFYLFKKKHLWLLRNSCEVFPPNKISEEKVNSDLPEKQLYETAEGRKNLSKPGWSGFLEEEYNESTVKILKIYVLHRVELRILCAGQYAK